MRSLTPIESVVLLSVVGSVLAVFVPAFVRDLRASRLAEPLDGLSQIARNATAIATTEGAYPASVGLTPEQVPEGQSVDDPEGTWEHPTWRALDFGFDRSHHFSFAFDSENQRGGMAEFTARAHGDLDGDGVFSTFRVSGQVSPGDQAVMFPIEMDREVE